MANLVFKELTKEKMAHLVAAEKELKKAGIIFETSVKLGHDRHYAWKLDSIKNAYVEYGMTRQIEIEFKPLNKKQNIGKILAQILPQRDSKGHFVKNNKQSLFPKRDGNGRFIK
jgi:hypothetical protein